MKRDRKPLSSRNSSKSATGTIRIIAGQYRGRKLPVLDAQGLRPTTDRTKETLFNWLMHDIHNASCLDLFAGSGGLGFEALSRYASKVTFVEKAVAAANQIKVNLDSLKVSKEHRDVFNGDALNFLSSDKSSYNIIFIDPPFEKNLVRPALESIAKSHVLAKDGLVYIEHESSLQPNCEEFGLSLLKQKSTSQVTYSLWQSN